MSEIKLIALDLDGTLLNSNKELTPGNAAALEYAAAQGIEIVPTTGRFFSAMPAVIQTLPYLHYAITVNGAQVWDIRKQVAVAKAELPLAQAVQIMEYLDTLPVIYDCFMENWGWMTKGMQDNALEFAPDRHYLNMLREFRTPVPELKAYLLERGKDVQKIQLFTKDMRLRQSLLRELEQRFADLSVSSSVVNNVEINNIHANKGEALQQLADYLQLGISQTMAFGDGLNDCSMIRQAGIGVAMENACPEVKAAADQMTKSCDEDGVATAILKILD